MRWCHDVGLVGSATPATQTLDQVLGHAGEESRGGSAFAEAVAGVCVRVESQKLGALAEALGLPFAVVARKALVQAAEALHRALRGGSGRVARKASARCNWPAVEAVPEAWHAEPGGVQRVWSTTGVADV